MVEKLEELTHILKVSAQMQVEPYIGFRVRLLSKGAGKWATSGGENAKFGLSTAELVAASDLLTRAGLAHALKLVHFHVGSQVPDIGTIKRATKEAARFYSKLQKMGHELGYLDVGGGLGVDYDGSRTTFDSSTNYSLNEYARDIVYSIMEVCDAEGVPHPTIVSESGRAIVAHHSVLIVEAFGSIEKSHNGEKVEADDGRPPDRPRHRRNLAKTSAERTAWRTSMMPTKSASAPKRCSISGCSICEPRRRSKPSIGKSPEPSSRCFEACATCPKRSRRWRWRWVTSSFAISRSFNRCSTIGRSGSCFPVMPIHRLNELPDRNATLVDITCDSDGKVSKFVDLQDVKETLPLHRWEPGEPYYIGFFLVGAYQDIMGDMHNLFGRVNEMHIYLDEDEDCGYYVEEVLPGSTIGQVLSLDPVGHKRDSAPHEGPGRCGHQERPAQAQRGDAFAR